MLSSGTKTFRNYLLFRTWPIYKVFEWRASRTPEQLEAASLDDAGRIKEAVSIPVIVTGGFQRAPLIRDAIERGSCDAVAIARGLIANNELVRMFAEGLDEAPRPCTYCNKCLYAVLESPLGCYDERRFDSREEMVAQIMSVFANDPARWPRDHGARPEHGFRAYVPLPKAERAGIGMCFSGGGYRASLFHAGAVRRLNEVGLLTERRHDHLGLGREHHDRAAPPTGASSATPGRPRTARAELRRGLRRAAPSLHEDEHPHPRRARPAPAEELVPQERRLGRAGARYADGPAPASSGASALRVRGDRHLEPGAVGLRRWPARDGARRPDVAGGGLAARARDRCVVVPSGVFTTMQQLDGESLELTDGGIYDNLGLEPIWRDHAVVLVSDAAPSFAPSRDGEERGTTCATSSRCSSRRPTCASDG